MDSNNITRTQCADFRTACASYQSQVRKLLEEAILHSNELNIAKAEQQEKHLSTLLTIFLDRDDDISNLHTKINSVKDKLDARFITMLIAAIVYLLGVIGIYAGLKVDINSNLHTIHNHEKSCQDTRSVVDFLRSQNTIMEKRLDDIDKRSLSNKNKISIKHGQIFIPELLENGD